MDQRLNAKKHPAGTRFLGRDRDYSGADIFEATVVEWSPNGLVKLRYGSGCDDWLESPPFLVEVLPSSKKGD